MANFKKEVELWSKVSHPNVNMFLGACTEPGNFMIVSELLKGDLDTLFLKAKADAVPKWSLYQRMKFAKDASLGVLWLHSLNPQIIHRDLKLSNLLIDDNYSCKICDFGLSQFKPQGESLQDRQRAKGTPLWMAPEVMMFQQFNEKADIYAFGLILWSLLTRLEPYLAYTDFPTFKHDVCDRHVRPVIPPDCPPSLALLIQRCWDPNPVARPPISVVTSELDAILVDCAVADTVGRHFWKTYFIGKEVVPWEDFHRGLLHFWSVNPADENFNFLMRCLKLVLATKVREQFVVQLTKLGEVLRWFGPMPQPPVPLERGMLYDIAALLPNVWFHGDISQDESEQRLYGKSPETFLVRFSTSSPGSYTVSRVSIDGTQFKHTRIDRTASGYTICFRPSPGAPPVTFQYPSLQNLVAQQIDYPDRQNSLGIRFPCSGSKYPTLLNSAAGGYELGGYEMG